MCSSKTSQTTSIPPASAMEQRMQQIFEDAILPQMIESSGYALEEQTIIRGGLTNTETARYRELKSKGITPGGDLLKGGSF